MNSINKEIKILSPINQPYLYGYDKYFYVGYYNLGNAFYRSGNIAGSVWAFESCLKLSPTHEDAKYNLRLAHLKVIDRMNLPEPPIYLKWYMSIKERFTPSTWINISFFILLIFSIIMTASQMTSLLILQNLRGSIIVVFFIFLHNSFRVAAALNLSEARKPPQQQGFLP